MSDVTDSPSRPSRKSILSNRHILGAAAVGVACIVLGFWLESLFVAAQLRAAAAAVAAHVDPASISHPAIWTLDASKLLVLFLKELGVACLIAGIVGWAIEKQAKELDIERAEALRKGIAHDALAAAFSVRHKPEYIKAVVATNLETAVVRSNMRLDYRLRELELTEAAQVFPHEPEKARARFVLLHMTSEYTFENNSLGPADVIIKNIVPRRRGAGARAVSRIQYMCVNGTVLTKAEIAECMKSRDDEDELRFELPKQLKSGAKLHVIANVETLKERSDNEVWGSIYPTMDGLDIKFTVLPGMNFDLRKLSAAELEPRPQVPEPNSKSWRLSGPLLPNNSLVFWWRIHEDDALDGDPSEPAMTEQERVENDSLPEKSPWARRVWRRLKRN